MDQIPSGSIDFTFGKVTLDVMIYGSPWDPPEEVFESTRWYIQQICTYLRLGMARHERSV